jgi:tRNA G18 (ribose-2'-O)-methylase SpoU
MDKKRGYFAIGIYGGKNSINTGTLWRSANIMGAAFIFTIGQRYKKQASDTMSTPKHVPLYQYPDFESFYGNMPSDCLLVGVELDGNAVDIRSFKHPERAMYLLGAEDNGLPKAVMVRCHRLVQLPGENSMNVSVAGSIVLYDRIRG